MDTVHVVTGTKTYDVLMDKGLDSLLKIHADKYMIVVDANFFSLNKDALEDELNRLGINYKIIVLKSGEENKRIENILYMYNEFNDYALTKSDVIVAVGGGVTGDMVAFAGATYLRGVRVIQVPTTLLSMVDSSIGGKCGIDMPFGKNLVGVIKQPEEVIVNTDYLKTLPEREISSGIAEVIKCGFIANTDILSELEKGGIDNIDKLIRMSLKVKADVVSEDEFESGKRMILNFGHTIGHAIEALGGYTRYSHGEAVAIGMCYALRLSCLLLGTDSEIYSRAVRIIKKYNLPQSTDYKIEDMMSYIMRDKKMRGETINFVLIKSIGEPVIMPIKAMRLGELIKESDKIQ